MLPPSPGFVRAFHVVRLEVAKDMVCTSLASIHLQQIRDYSHSIVELVGVFRVSRLDFRGISSSQSSLKISSRGPNSALSAQSPNFVHLPLRLFSPTTFLHQPAGDRNQLSIIEWMAKIRHRVPIPELFVLGGGGREYHSVDCRLEKSVCPEG